MEREAGGGKWEVGSGEWRGKWDMGIGEGSGIWEVEKEVGRGEGVKKKDGEPPWIKSFVWSALPQFVWSAVPQLCVVNDAPTMCGQWCLNSASTWP